MTVIVSGALQGLGACLVKEFLSEDDSVFAIIRPGLGYGELSDEINNPNLKLICADLEKKQDMDNAYKQISNATKKVDALINVAGILLNKEGLITQDTYENLEQTFKINTIAPIYMNNLFLPLMASSEKPTFINICSETKTIDDAGDWFPAYCISKTALAQYCFAFKATLNKLEIDARVFAVHPGRMSTAMGGANSEITAQTSAMGIISLAKAKLLKNNEEIYVNYKGEPMLTK